MQVLNCPKWCFRTSKNTLSSCRQEVKLEDAWHRMISPLFSVSTSNWFNWFWSFSLHILWETLWHVQMVDGWSSPSDSPRLGLLCLDRDSLRSSRSSLLRLSSAALRLTCNSQKDNTKIPAYDLVSRSELSSQPVQNGTKHLSLDPKTLCPPVQLWMFIFYYSLLWSWINIARPM